MISSIFQKMIWLEYESKKKEKNVSPKSQIDKRLYLFEK